MRKEGLYVYDPVEDFPTGLSTIEDVKSALHKLMQELDAFKIDGIIYMMHAKTKDDIISRINKKDGDAIIPISERFSTRIDKLETKKEDQLNMRLEAFLKEYMPIILDNLIFNEEEIVYYLKIMPSNSGTDFFNGLLKNIETFSEEKIREIVGSNFLKAFEYEFGSHYHRSALRDTIGRRLDQFRIKRGGVICKDISPTYYEGCYYELSIVLKMEAVLDQLNKRKAIK